MSGEREQGRRQLAREILQVYKRFRLSSYRKMFGQIRERDGSLSATEAFAADVIYLLERPTVTQLAETLGISQPNATYKVNNLAAKGYVVKSSSEGDRRECRLLLGEKFYNYYNTGEEELEETLKKLEQHFTDEEMETFGRVLSAFGQLTE